ncbi:MAG: DUF2499 domain-containing protein [Chlorobium sp.]|nr:DUF2499 domain-containing protein [Chlorobium sp.]MCW8814661.1 DUF2499 domain-containing protein [Chlorobium sp.]MCW8820049.1 DUF2499 domain-containing protein [Ignavibacteriaceae bacterium]
MLLSLPNWLIHISSSLEWGIASLMMYRYGTMIGRKDVQRFGLFMIPHWIGSWFVLAYHVRGDQVPVLLDLSETVNLFGSMALLYASLNILKTTGRKGSAKILAAAGIFLISGRPQSYMGEDIFDLILQLSSLVYLSFLVSLTFIRKRDPEVFSRMTIAGFWFVVVFISVTVSLMYVSTEIRGFATLSHDDLLHGGAESLLTISNMMIIIGIHRQIKRFEKRQIESSSMG